MVKAHIPINWINSPNANTPINATNLNKMDTSIGVIDDRVIQLSTQKANQEDVQKSVSEIKSDLSDMKNNLSNDLNGLCEIGTVSGYPIGITDALEGSVVSCVTEAETVTRIGHNMVKIKEYYNEDYYGVTYHCDSKNGTVTVSGTATGGNAVISATENSSIHLEAGKTYFIGGNPNGYNTSNAWIRLYDSKSGSYVGRLGEFTPDADMDVSIRIRINNGLTVENLVFTPVVCLAEEVQTCTPSDLRLLRGDNFIFNGNAKEMKIEYRNGVQFVEKKFLEEISGAYTESFSVTTNTMEFMKNPWVLSCLAYYESASGEQPTIQFQLVDENGNELYYSMPYVVGSDKEYYRREWRIPASREHYNRVKISFVIPNGVTLYVKDFTHKGTGRFRSGDIGVKYHAHQGFSGLTASSTIDSFQSASEVGFASCITIPKFTSDGVGVCFHDDDTIRKEVRYADGSVIASGSADDKPVSEFTYEELLRFDKGIKKDAIYVGQKIATIDDFFRICSMTGMSPIFSVHGTSQFYQSGDGVVNFNAIRKLAEKWRVLDNLWIKSGDPNVQKASLSVFGTDIGGYIMIQGASSTWDIVNQANLCGFDFSKHKVVMEYFYSAITEEKIQNAIDGGFYAVSVATTGDGISGAEMTRLIELGVTEFTIDHHCSMGLDW